MLARLFVSDLKMIFRNKQALFWALAFPIMFATIFGLFRLDQLPEAKVAVVPSALPATAPVRMGLQQVPSMVVCGPAAGEEDSCGDFPRHRDGTPIREDFESSDRAREAVRRGDLDFALIVDRGAGDGFEVTVITNGTAADRNRIFVPLIQRVLDQVNMGIANIRPTYTMEQQAVAGESQKYYDFVLPGLVGMAVMTYGIIGLGGTVAQWRGQKILRRIRATPLRPATFLTAVVLSHLVLALVQSGLVLAFGVFVFGATVKGNVLWIMLFVLLGNLTFLNIGFMVATRVETAEAASGLGNSVAMPMMFFSGVFFPTNTLPWILPALTSILPLHPLVSAIRRIAIEGATITELGSEAWQLAAWAAATFLLASRMFKFERA